MNPIAKILGLLAAAPLVFCPLLRAQTAVPACLSGALAANTTLTPANSPYTVCGDLMVNSGVTLTIQAGVKVYLEAGVNLTVASGGRLLALGSAEAPVLFSHPAGSSARWGGIVINGGAGTPETQLTHTRIEFNGATAIHSSGGTLLLDSLTFGSTDHQYVSLDGSSFLLSNCEFPTTSAAFELVHGTGGIKAGGHGIVRDCFFGSTTGYNDIMDFTGGNRPNQPLIEYYNNVFIGGSDDGLDLDGTDAWIEGNIFLHIHRNGAPDSSSAISGGDNGADTSQITIVGNLFFDCDNAATAKQGNFFSFVNNTIVHMTKVGGVDFDSSVVNVRDTTPALTTFGKGYYMEGNVIVDAPQLVRNYDAAQTTVTFNNNILPEAWTGPGSGNLVADPKLKHIPTVSETRFTTFDQAQILRDWFSLLPGSPAIGTGPNELDMGGVIPLGASISGEPGGLTAQTTATLRVGFNRVGSGIPSDSWNKGMGYVAYKWRLDGGAWSAETPIATPISLSGLADGPHYVEVTGKRDVGTYQDNPLLGPDAVISRSRTWTVQTSLRFASINRSADGVSLHFLALAGATYTVEYKNSLSDSSWTKLTDVAAQASSTDVQILDKSTAGLSRFYRLVSPSQS